MPKLLIVNEPNLFTDLLISAFANDPAFEVVGLVASFEEALSTLPRNPPEVILVNYLLPETTGLSAIRNILQQCPSVRAILLSPSDAVEVVAAAVQSGCSGIITPHHSLKDVRNAAIMVASGATAFSPEMLTKAMTLLVQPPSNSKVLTARELEVLQRLSRGEAAADIAAHLGLRVNTVRSHIRQIFEKLGAHSKFEALELGKRRGLLFNRE